MSQFARATFPRIRPLTVNRFRRTRHVYAPATGSTSTCLSSSSHLRYYEPYNQQRCRYLSSYKIAIVGSGPSGCYTAKYLHTNLEKMGLSDHSIHVLERLPTPFGLVRFGVAPDHPEVKNVEKDFAKLFELHSKNIQYFGNVNVGTDISIQELRQTHHAVVLAYGCESDRKLGIKGEDSLDGVLSARQFVAWYNGHPDFVHIGEKVQKALGTREKDGVRQTSVVVIGQGNVALDCARILAKGSDGLYDTDIAAHALPVLVKGVSEVSVVGRRGHIQGAFTIKELRELIKLEDEGHDTSFSVRSEELDLGTTDASLKELETPAARPKKRIDKLLRDSADIVPKGNPAKRVNLRFLLSPKEFQPHDSDSTSLGWVVCERTELQGDAGHQNAVGTGRLETLPASMALVSIGYKGVALPGTEMWFDERKGVMSNEKGRVAFPAKGMGGIYTAGWLKRGPSGIIGTNITDAKDTVVTIMQDLVKETVGNLSSNSDLMQLLISKGVLVVDWQGVCRIHESEYNARRSDTQPREKLIAIQKQLRIAVNGE